MKKIIIAITVLPLAFSCGEKSTADKLKAKEEQFNNLRQEITDLKLQQAKEKGTMDNDGKTVHLTTIGHSAFSHSIDIQGHVDADQSVSVSPQMPGLVQKVYVQPGDKVSEGQLLAEINADALVQQVSALKVQLDLAKQVYDRQKNLWDQKIGTEVQYLQAQSQYEGLQKQISVVQEQIDMARLRAPMSGTVDQVNMKTGEIAAAGISSIVIINTSKLRVKGEVAEGYVDKVKTGDPVQLYFPDAGKTITTKVTYSGQLINKLNRTFNVEVMLDANEPGIVPNMVAVIHINDYKNDTAIVAPLSVIQQSADGRNYVYVAVKDTKGKLIAQRRDIVYDRTYNGNAEIESGLSLGDQLITEGYTDLNDGDLLSVK